MPEKCLPARFFASTQKEEEIFLSITKWLQFVNSIHFKLLRWRRDIEQPRLAQILSLFFGQTFFSVQAEKHLLRCIGNGLALHSPVYHERSIININKNASNELNALKIRRNFIPSRFRLRILFIFHRHIVLAPALMFYVFAGCFMFPSLECISISSGAVATS